MDPLHSRRLIYDLDFRPLFYEPAHALALVRSQARRRLLHDRSLTEEAVEALLDEQEETLRAEMGALHPSLMSGEYLPQDEAGEVEIARLVLASVTGDVISVRAVLQQDGYAYRVVDEYETDFACPSITTEQPLTMGELVSLLGAVELIEGGHDLFEGRGLVKGLWQRQVMAGRSPEETAAFVSVESDVYPHLGVYYASQAEAWVRQN